MKLEQLTMFVTVAKLGSLSLASKQLYKTQPAISQGIKQLEYGFDITLFNRSKYRLELTQAGEALYEKAANLLAEAKAIEQMAEHIALGNEMAITIAIEASFNLKGILPLLQNVQNQFPKTKIIIKQEHISGAMEALIKEDATLCISPLANIFENEKKIDKHFLIKGALLNVTSPALFSKYYDIDSNLTGENNGELLLNEYQIVMQDSGRGSKDKEWGVQDGQRKWYVNDFSTKKMLIENAMGFGKLPDYLVENSLKEGRLVLLDLKKTQNKVLLKYYIMKNKSKVLGPVAQALWDQFRNYTFNTNHIDTQPKQQNATKIK